MPYDATICPQAMTDNSGHFPLEFVDKRTRVGEGVVATCAACQQRIYRKVGDLLWSAETYVIQEDHFRL